MGYIKQSGGNLLIGARASHHDIQNSKLVREKAFLLSECAGLIGDAEIRNMGTVGGSLSHCDPSGDWGAAVLAMRGILKIRGPSKERSMMIDDFLVDTFTSALKPNEILTEISIPVPAPRSGGAYVSLKGGPATSQQSRSGCRCPWTAGAFAHTPESV